MLQENTKCRSTYGSQKKQTNKTIQPKEENFSFQTIKIYKSFHGRYMHVRNLPQSLPVICNPVHNLHRTSQSRVAPVGPRHAVAHWKVCPGVSWVGWVWPETHTAWDWRCQTQCLAALPPPACSVGTSNGSPTCLMLKQKRTDLSI